MKLVVDKKYNLNVGYLQKYKRTTIVQLIDGQVVYKNYSTIYNKWVYGITDDQNFIGAIKDSSQ